MKLTSLLRLHPFKSLYNQSFILQILISDILYLYAYIFSILFKIFPINDEKIVFSNFNGKGYADNPKYIAEELFRQNKHADYVWLIKNTEDSSSIPSYMRIVDVDSIKAIYEYATARIWINNFGIPLYIHKRRKQIYIDTWHGSALKKIGADAIEGSLPSLTTLSLKKRARETDLLLTNSRLQDEIYRRAFLYEKEYLKVGTPRNDILASNDLSRKEKIWAKLESTYNIKRNQNILLYAPTFRKDLNLTYYTLDLTKCLLALTKCFGGEWIVFLRLHPIISHKSHEIINSSTTSIYDVSAYADMQELLCISDVLITDYSSSMFDFCLTKKPCFLYVPDLDAYDKNDRGFYTDPRTLPFSLCLDMDDLINCIGNFDEMRYKQQVTDFLTTSGDYNKGHAAKEVVNWLYRRL